MLNHKVQWSTLGSSLAQTPLPQKQNIKKWRVAHFVSLYICCFTFKVQNLVVILFFPPQDLGFIWLNSEVQTARFKMRTNKLMLHEDFYVSLMELPEEYDFGMYSRFFNTFGTHYITEGTMGGTLEHVVIVNKTTLRNLGTGVFHFVIRVPYHIITCDVK